MNYFSSTEASTRYASYRPFIHPLVVDKISETFGKPVIFNKILDVGCGTGQSTSALKSIGTEIYGVDSAEHMVEQCQPESGISFRVSPAESLPFPDSFFDLVTVGMAFHWFDQAKFLAEARRVLTEDGYLIVYNNFLSSNLVNDSRYSNWMDDFFFTKFPRAIKKEKHPSPELAGKFGFSLWSESTFSYELIYKLDEFIEYLTTQSNVIAAIESGNIAIEDARAAFLNSLTDLFGIESKAINFSGRITFWKPSPTSVTHVS